MSLRAEIMGRYNDAVDDLREIIGADKLDESVLIYAAKLRIESEFNAALEAFINERKEFLAKKN